MESRDISGLQQKTENPCAVGAAGAMSAEEIAEEIEEIEWKKTLRAAILFDIIEKLSVPLRDHYAAILPI